MMKNNQPYFMLNLSPWPIFMSINIFNLMISNIMFINFKFNTIFIINILLMFF